jgi:WD40 repeat protein
VVIAELPKTAEDVKIASCLRRELTELSDEGRAIVKPRKKFRKSAKQRPPVDDDVEMDAPEELEDIGEIASAHAGEWISCMAASDDGQWLAFSDLKGRVEVWNLDTLRVSSIHQQLLTCSRLENYPHCPLRHAP